MLRRVIHHLVWVLFVKFSYSCNAPFFLTSTSCENCYPGFYGDVATRVCLACFKSCATCTNGTANDCVTCGVGYFQLNTSCYSTCPSVILNFSNDSLITQTRWPICVLFLARVLITLQIIQRDNVMVFLFTKGLKCD